MIIPWESRKIRPTKPSVYIQRYNYVRYEQWYDYLINRWILDQPDAVQLMRLFIGMNFNPLPFILVVRWGRDWIRHIKTEESK